MTVTREAESRSRVGDGVVPPRAVEEAVDRLRLPGILLGVGLVGLVDGIVFHQILQWHHMLTSEGSYPATTIAGLETNTLWDGVFHVASLGAAVTGLAMLWRRLGERTSLVSGRALLGWILVGAGAFDVLEGLALHLLLGLHHLREGSGSAELAGDLAYVLSAALVAVVGLSLVRSARRRVGARARVAAIAPLPP